MIRFPLGECDFLRLARLRIDHVALIRKHYCGAMTSGHRR
jgi:hypothetical protein